MDMTADQRYKWGTCWNDCENGPKSKLEQLDYGSFFISLDKPLVESKVLDLKAEESSCYDCPTIFGIYPSGSHALYLAFKSPYYTDEIRFSQPNSYHKQTFYCRHVLQANHQFDPVSVIRKIRFEIEGLSEWAHGFGETVDDSVILFDSEGDGEKFSIELQRSTVDTREQYGSETTALCIVWNNGCEFDVAIHRMQEMADFVSFCFDDNLMITRLDIMFEECDSYVKDLYYSSHTERTPFAYSNILIPLKECASYLSSGLKEWFFGDSQIKIIRDMLLAEYKNDISSMDLSILRSAQILEAISKAAANSLKSLPEEEFDEKIQNLEQYIGDKDLLKWVKERIRNDKGQKRLIRELLEKHEKSHQLFFKDRSSFVDYHTKMRNTLTHRTKNIENLGAETHRLVTLALCYIIFAQMLGFDQDKLIHAISCSPLLEQMPPKSSPYAPPYFS